MPDDRVKTLDELGLECFDLADGRSLLISAQLTPAEQASIIARFLIEHPAPAPTLGRLPSRHRVEGGS